MRTEQPMYEGDSQLRVAPYNAEFPAIRRLIEAFRALREMSGQQKPARRTRRTAIRARAQHA
jgi:hypothetical protein